ncbi:unnamed protein product [Chironomus riparius]|uniref:Uncharacterized protein n=1 Tax=Chironomus riparius TaxID=315576 RepID=A0A9N9S6I3_9DIPT|nr:unnamed protein product [Chironomus riparius]
MKLITLVLVTVVLSKTVAAQQDVECGNNESFFNQCQSSTRNSCDCSDTLRRDCRLGCMCNIGYCRKDFSSSCVQRSCQHPYFA